MLTPEEQLTKQTYNNLAKLFADTHSTPNFYKEELKIFEKLLPKGKVLEIGAGSGRDAQELIETGYDYVGTDISSELIRIAQSNNPNVEFHEIGIYDLNFPDKFDGFWCMATLIHIPKRRIVEALQAIKRNIKPEAIGLLSVKEGEGEGVERKIDTDGEGRLFCYWQDNEFKEVLKKNGFTVQKEWYRPISKRSKWLIYLVKNTR